jgi:hypothetical protein
MISAYHQNWMKHLECPLWNIAANIDASEKSDFRKNGATVNSSWEQNASASGSIKIPPSKIFF